METDTVDFTIAAFFILADTIDASALGLIILVGVICIGLLFSAIFSGAEVALFSVYNQEDDYKKIRERNSSDDEKLDKMLSTPRRLLATILIGNTFANVITSVSAAVLTGQFVHYLALETWAIFAIEVIVVTFIILILSEITPKTIAINNPIAASRKFTPIIYVFYRLLKPFSRIIAKSTITLEKRIPKPDYKLSANDIRVMAEATQNDGLLKEDEREIIENVIEFGTTTVKEIMTSRLNIEAVSVDDSLEEVMQLIREKGYSRMPLYDGDVDHILGVVFAKDILPYVYTDMTKVTLNWKTIARPVMFVPPSKKLDDLLRDFQHEKTHLAIVVDEYGGTEGIITLDDLLEEIIGDFDDEHSYAEDALFQKFKNGVYHFDSSIDLDDMEDILGIPLTADDDDYETLGGLVYHLMERLPKVDEKVEFNGLELTIISVEKNRVRKIKVKKLETDAS